MSDGQNRTIIYDTVTETVLDAAGCVLITTADLADVGGGEALSEEEPTAQQAAERRGTPVLGS